MSGLTVRFGGLEALHDVALDLGEGEVVGLIGPNGAGKTTLIDAVTGFVGYLGHVVVAGDSLDGLRPDQRAARGLSRTFQSLELFEDLTIYENVAVGPATSPQSVTAALASTGLVREADQLPGSLAPARRRFVAMARAVAADPRVLLVDEVTAGLDAGERDVLAERLRAIAAAGCGVLLVDHDLGLVADVCHRVIVLDAGRVIASGSPVQVRRDERVLAAYLGP